MRISKHISGRFLQAVFGVFIALFVLTQAVVVPTKVEDKQEQSDSEKGDSQQVKKAEAVPSSSLQINLDYQSYLLTEVFYQDQEQESAPIEKLVLPTTNKALKVLFRRIISPNAP